MTYGNDFPTIDITFHYQSSSEKEDHGGCWHLGWWARAQSPAKILRKAGQSQYHYSILDPAVETAKIVELIIYTFNHANHLVSVTLY